MYTPALEHLCIVMVETSHPGNIGSAARAMKVMGIQDLRLVAPRKPYSQDTWALASGANDIIEQAKIVPTLQDAVADCHIVIGASARSERTLQWPQMDSRECGVFVAEHLPQQKIALVFGRERSGLTNEELDHCNTLVHIPMAFDFFSLNIAMAIQVLAYECATAVRLAMPSETTPPDPDDALASAESMESFYTHLEQSMIATRFLDPENPRLLMRRLRRLFGRAGVTVSEMNILRGMLAAFAGRKFQTRE
ncbi:RNA methyltransferase [Thiothrix subterranea]|uniref:tRNA (cytidine/uridine-2'-O-)-methyltransferase TrmJ n=2 Tax=Thiothrix subterranea TaxID=2735563 RepID=A0AA51MPY4_9GAMM|nr:RNA methyltransferase [Thiothrix subterranea]MDQ5768986.1 RNA methyltransferase [Thiothrix subterranea]WML86101.1 RNA methyltransferase [Thiothrix subterranea]